ncbi:hypothetical protein L218DRAFT_1004998 [Marasmius fiardii PR-910]|nr:hypothetical protein L218DRAFT_1004998 [Marasmius fiardii PR-910]
MHPNAHFTCDTKLFKLLEVICEAFYDLYIRWCMRKDNNLHISDSLVPFKAMASTFITSNEAKVGGYKALPEYFQFMLSVSHLANKICQLSSLTLPSYLKSYYSTDKINDLKETLSNDYWDFRDRLPDPPKMPSFVKTSKVSSGKAQRVQSPVVIKKELGTNKHAREPSPGPVNKKPKLDISSTNTLFGSKSGESKAIVEEDIEEAEANKECDELDDINQFSGDEVLEESPLSSVPTHDLELVASIASSSKGKGKAKAVMVLWLF